MAKVQIGVGKWEKSQARQVQVEQRAGERAEAHLEAAELRRRQEGQAAELRRLARKRVLLALRQRELEVEEQRIGRRPFLKTPAAMSRIRLGRLLTTLLRRLGILKS